MKYSSLVSIVAGAAVLSVLSLSACADSASSGSGATGPSVEFGAESEEFQEALADMDPVTLTYQPSTPSPEDPAGAVDAAFAEAVEEKSGGKITMEVAWGQSIASLGEVVDAVADGRIDIGFETPAAVPDELPVFNEFIKLGPTAPASPFVNEMANMAAMQETAWNTQAFVDELSAQGVEPLRPMLPTYASAVFCSSPVTSSSDFTGQQIRVGNRGEAAILEELGATPVSVEFTEVFDALQRGTIDCALVTPQIAVLSGLIEGAPHVTFPEDAVFSRGGGLNITGPEFQNLPLAARQLIFDELNTAFAGWNEAYIQSLVDTINISAEHDGSINVLEEEAEEKIASAFESIRDDVEGSEVVDGPNLVTEFESAVNRWIAVAEEEGYEDSNDYESFAKEFSPDSFDLQPFAERVFEEVHLPHRPS